MKPLSLIKAILLPVMSVTVLLPLLLLWAILSIGTSGHPMGILVLILSLPPIFRYLMIVLETCAKGENPRAFDAEFFSWTDSLWTFFPLLLAIALTYLGFTIHGYFGTTGVYALLVVVSGALPASFAVLAITHSPLQSLNPVALGRLLNATAESFWLASVYLIVIGWVFVQAGQLPNMAGNFVYLFGLFSFAALTGTLLEPFGLVDDVSIPESPEANDEEIRGNIEAARASVLSHAYGFISRGNRDSGLTHIKQWIADDQDPEAAWAWYFNKMLGWENQQHALFFAQHYVHDLLRHGDTVPALKIIMRCRLINDRFKPLGEDVPVAIEAAESVGNRELATVLKRR